HELGLNIQEDVQELMRFFSINPDYVNEHRVAAVLSLWPVVEKYSFFTFTLAFHWVYDLLALELGLPSDEVINQVRAIDPRSEAFNMANLINTHRGGDQASTGTLLAILKFVRVKMENSSRPPSPSTFAALITGGMGEGGAASASASGHASSR